MKTHDIPGKTGELEASREHLTAALLTVETLFNLPPDHISLLTTPDIPGAQDIFSPVELFTLYQARLGAALTTIVDAQYEISPFGRVIPERQYVWTDGTVAERLGPDYGKDESGNEKHKVQCSAHARAIQGRLEMTATDRWGTGLFSQEFDATVIIPTDDDVKRLLGDERQCQYTYAEEPNSYTERNSILQYSELSNDGILTRHIDDFAYHRGLPAIYGSGGYARYSPCTTPEAKGALRYIELERQIIARFLQALSPAISSLAPEDLQKIIQTVPQPIAADPDVTIVRSWNSEPLLVR